MAKKHKIVLADRLIALYHLFTGRPAPAATLRPDCMFSCVVVYSTTALGDLMFNTPALRQLRQRYPQARLVLVVHRKYVDLLQDYGDVDLVLCWDGRFAGLPAFVHTLRREKPELAVILHSRAPYDVLSAVFSGCRHVLRDDNFQHGYVPLKRWLAGASTPDYPGHVIQRKLDLLTRLGCDASQTSMCVPCPVHPGRYADDGALRVGFQLGASTPERCWPPAFFARLAVLLLAEYPRLRIVLMGTAQERPLEQAFLAALKHDCHSRVESLLGKTSVRDVFDVVAGLAVLVTGDTGPLHLAVALRVPSVGLFVTAEPEKTGPYQDPALHTIIKRSVPDGCEGNPMQAIPVDMVANAVHRVLSGVCDH